MAYNYRSRLDHVGTRMKVLNKQTVDYIRGADTITGILATPTRTDQQEIIPNAAITNVRNQDWILDTNDLRIGGNLIEPDYGDEIETETGERYRVVAYRASTLENEAPFSYITTTKTRIRIHTVHIN